MYNMYEKNTLKKIFFKLDQFILPIYNLQKCDSYVYNYEISRNLI